MLKIQHSVNLRQKYFIGSGPGVVSKKIQKKLQLLASFSPITHSSHSCLNYFFNASSKLSIIIALDHTVSVKLAKEILIF